MRPFFLFYGSKWNISRHFPSPVGSVVEPFAGSAGYSVFYGVPTAILVDKDPVLIGIWQYLIKARASEIRRLPLMPEVGDGVDNYHIPQEAKWLIGFWLNRGSAQPKKSRTAYSARTDKAQLNWGVGARERIANQIENIRGWKASEGDYSIAPKVHGTTFIDPPYGDKGKFYKVKFSEFETLAKWCRRRQGMLRIVCGGDGDRYLPFKDLGSFKSSKGRAQEKVWVR